MTRLRASTPDSEAIRSSASHRTRMPIAVFILLILGSGITGCGNSLYLVQVSRAERVFQEAKELGAERHAPYEYYSAKVRLEEAKRQAAEAEYGNAADLSDEATDFSSKAIAIAKKAKEPSQNSEPTK